MERLKLRLKLARDALRTLEDALPIRETRESRDVAILRFTYTCEATWKAAQAWLDEHGGLQVASPKGVARECFRSGLFAEDDAEAILRMLDYRNAAVHVYDEAWPRRWPSACPAMPSCCGRGSMRWEALDRRRSPYCRVTAWSAMAASMAGRLNTDDASVHACSASIRAQSC